MYYIRKYADCWAIHDDITGASRKLTAEEVEKVTIEFPSLQDEKVVAFYTDRIRSVQPDISRYPNPGTKPENRLPGWVAREGEQLLNP